MPAVNPRVSVVLEEPLYKFIKLRAKREGVTLSMVMRDMARDAAEAEEDAVLNAWITKREKKTTTGFLTHEQVWKNRV